MATDPLSEYRLKLEERERELRAVVQPAIDELALIRQELELLDRMRELQSRRQNPAADAAEAPTEAGPLRVPEVGPVRAAARMESVAHVAPRAIEEDRRRSALGDLVRGVFEDAGGPLHRGEAILLVQERARRAGQPIPSGATITTRLSRDRNFAPLESHRGYWRLATSDPKAVPKGVGREYAETMEAFTIALRRWVFSRRQLDELLKTRPDEPSPQFDRRVELRRMDVPASARRLLVFEARLRELREVLGEAAPLYPSPPELGGARHEIVSDASRGGAMFHDQ
jgi:hypothetical protein